MRKTNPAHDYMRMKVTSASPIGLVVLLYDIGLEALNAAVRALEAGDVEGRTRAINRAQAVLGELQGALDYDKGGEVAQLLRDYYTLAREQLVEAHTGETPDILQSVIADFGSLHEAWREVERTVDGSGSAPEGTPGALRVLPAGDESTSGSWSA